MRVKEFKEGMKNGFPICLGYISVSMAFGLSAAKMGIPVWTAVLMSLTNLTSAGQFAGTTLLATDGTYLELIASMLIINIRYFLMSLSVSQKVDDEFSIGKRLIASFGITDEVFAVSTQRKGKLSFSYMLGLISTPILGWTMGTLLGAALTSLLPEALSDAMGIALYGMFIAIIVPPMKEDKSIIVAVVIAILFSCSFYYIPYLNQIPTGITISICAVVAALICAFLFPVKEETQNG